MYLVYTYCSTRAASARPTIVNHARENGGVVSYFFWGGKFIARKININMLFFPTIAFIIIFVYIVYNFSI